MQKKKGNVCTGIRISSGVLSSGNIVLFCVCVVPPSMLVCLPWRELVRLSCLFHSGPLASRYFFAPVAVRLAVSLLPARPAQAPEARERGPGGSPAHRASALTARRAVRAAQTGAQRGPGCKQRPRRVARPQFCSLGRPVQCRRAGRACPKGEGEEGNGVRGVTRPVPASGMRGGALGGGTPAGSGMQVQGGLCGMCQRPARASGSVVVCGWCWGYD